MTDSEMIERIIMEDDEELIGFFCMHIGYDWHDKPEHDAAIYPKWSEVTKAIWVEIKRRMQGTVTQEFDYDGALEKLKDIADDYRSGLHTPSRAAEYSYLFGYVRGIERACGIIKQSKRSKRWKPKEAKQNADKT